MARENYVHLIGRIVEIEAINDISDIFTLEVVRRNGKKDFPRVVIYESFKKCKDCSVNDFVFIKGIMASRGKRQIIECDICGDTRIIEGFETVVNAIDIVKLSEDLDFQDLKEISNQVFILGVVCRKVKYRKLASGISNAQYQLAINRKLHVYEENHKKSDYVFVTSLSNQADEDYKRLDVGSQCFINGGIQNRSIVREIMCNECENIIKLSEQATEICTYNVEYLNNCKF